MEKGLVEQEREISDLVRRAQKNPDRTGNQRRETLRKLIELTHSPYPSLKSYAAGNLKHFFRDFPELEETAINAVYDLCEDQLSKIRIDGYTAIVQVSREQKKWVKRNADVLVQLLQSDEPDEVIVVKKALSEHLDMDPRVTLGVLCDQITPVDEPMDEEDQETRDRLRSLVLSFLTGEAKRAIIERHASQAGSEPEKVLIDGLLTAITKSSNAEVELIVKELLLSLPSYRPQSPRALSLLQMLLDTAQTSLRNETRPGEPVSLINTRFFLDLAGYVAIEKRMAPSVDLLRFFCTSLTSKMLLQRFPQVDQIWVITSILNASNACDNAEQQRGSASEQQVIGFRKQIVGASPIFLEILEKSNMTTSGSWNACSDLLHICWRHKTDSGWTVPPHLAEHLRRMQDLAERRSKEENNSVIHSVQDKIRLLVPPPVQPTLQATSSATNTNMSQDSSSSATLKNGAVLDQPEATSSVSQVVNQPARRMFIASRSRADKPAVVSAPSTAQEIGSSGATTAPSKRTNITDDSLPSSKRIKKDGEGNVDVAPSLLSRMATSTSMHSASQPQRRNYATWTTEGPPSSVDEPPAGGFSIKGAAKAEEELRRKVGNSWQVPKPSSLLDRIKGSDSASIGGEDGEPGGRKKKWRKWES